MAVRIFYIDESYNDDVFCLSALSIRHTDWTECFSAIREHRRQLKEQYGIPLYKEIHARDLVRGRGKISDRDIGKWDRSRIYLGILKLATTLPNVMLINVCLPKKGIKKGLPDAQLMAWERMTNRIERTLKAFEQVEHPKRRKWMEKLREAHTEGKESLTEAELAELEFRLQLFRSRAILFADEGRETEIERALRRMRVYNPIPSKYQSWQPGVHTKNITTERIIEDPAFKQSSRSYFLQLADCIAFALLKKEVPPTPHIKKYGVDEMFDVLKDICYKKASPRDKYGIVR